MQTHCRLAGGLPVQMEAEQEEKKSIEYGVMWLRIDVVHLGYQLRNKKK